MENREHHAPCFFVLIKSAVFRMSKTFFGQSAARWEPVKLLHRSFTSVSETWRFTGGDKYGIIN